MSVTRIATSFALLAFASAGVASDLSGKYTVEGSNPNGTPYKGALLVTPRGDAWRFEWNAGSVSYGIGVEHGAKIAVAVGGEQCAVVLYHVQPDGSLQGVWTTPQGGAVRNETAKTAGTTLAGDYTVEGTSDVGKPYRGTLRVAEEGEHWRLSWNLGPRQYEGYGLERDGYLGVSWGSASCGVVLYQLGASGWDGEWKYYQTGVGRERVMAAVE